MRKSFIISLIPVILGIFFLFCGCSSPPLGQANYDECRKLLEEARKEAKRKETYSYSPKDYEECRRRAYFQLEITN